MGAIHTDRPRSYLVSIIVPTAGYVSSQDDVKQWLPQPYGDTEFIFDQDVLAVLEITRVHY
jgi:hypothetical protein